MLLKEKEESKKGESSGSAGPALRKLGTRREPPRAGASAAAEDFQKQLSARNNEEASKLIKPEQPPSNPNKSKENQRPNGNAGQGTAAKLF